MKNRIRNILVLNENYLEIEHTNSALLRHFGFISYFLLAFNSFFLTIFSFIFVVNRYT